MIRPGGIYYSTLPLIRPRTSDHNVPSSTPLNSTVGIPNNMECTQALLYLVVHFDIWYYTVRDRLFRMRKKSFYRQVMKLAANEASVQGLQNALENECHTKFLAKLWAFENRHFVCGIYDARVHGKIQYK